MEKFVIEDLTPVELEFPAPDGKTYLLREASEGAAIKWQQAMFANAKVDPSTNKPINVDLAGIVSADSLLVSMCLFAPNDKGEGYKKHNVDLSVVHSWPQRVIKQLFAKIKQISPELSNKEPVKNSGSAGTDTSA